MKEESHNPEIDSELEARIVALVLGEASDFERDELNRLIEQRPELATLKAQMQSVHGLLRDVGAGESVADDEDWKLSAEKRSAVLAVISGEAQEQPAIPLASKPDDQRRSRQRNFLKNIAKIAAVLLVAGFIGSMAIPSVNRARTSRLASNVESAPNSKDTTERLMGKASAPAVRILMSEGAVSMTADEERSQAADALTTLESDYENSSKSALLAIRANLGVDPAQASPYYVMDDVQYYPTVPKVKLPREVTASGEASALKRPAKGVNGPGPGQQSVPAIIAQDVANWSDRRSRGGNRTTDSQAMQNAGKGGLSFPRFTVSPRERVSARERDASEPAPVRSTLSVPDEGAERQSEVRGKYDVAGEPRGSSPAVLHNYGESQQGGEKEDAASEPMAGLGMGDRPDENGKPASSSDLFLGYAVTGERFRAGGTPTGTDDSVQHLADGESPAGREYGGGGYGGGGAISDERKENISAGQTPAEVAQLKSGDLRNLEELQETAPSEPLAAGMRGKTEKKAAGESFNTRAVDSAGIANSIPSPTTKPTASKEDLKQKGGFAFSGEDHDRFMKEHIVTPSADDVAILKGRTPDHHAFDNRQIPLPMTGTAIGQPRPALQAGQTKPGWRYEGLGNNPQGKPSTPDELRENSLPADYGQDAETYNERIESQQNDKQAALGRQRDYLSFQGQDRSYRYVPMAEDESKSMKKKVADFAKIAGDTITRDIAGRRFDDETKRLAAPAGLNEKTAKDEAFSTFSLHVSDVSFKLAQAALAQGEWPEAAKVRIEEFVNAFDYGDPMPCQSEKVACRMEQSIHPFLQQRNLLRVSMRTAAAGRASNTPLRLTFLLDNSGSMERIDRQQTVRRAFALLAQQLKPIDQVTLISFARQPRLLADKVSGAQSQQLVELIQNLPSEGGTNIEAALQLAFEKAQEQQIDDAQNRIILLTDGAVNLGDANPDSLSRMVTTMRDAGIAFDAAGISAEGLNDEILEALTRQGDGRYYLLDSLEAADDGFARQIAGALRPSAKNVKVQIEFNPKRVGRYKLLGFEKHRLKQEDFRDDKVDAAEMSAAEAGVAVYQFEAKPDGEGDVGSVSVRFRDLSTGQMIENRWPIPYEADAPRLDQAAPSLRIATSAALLAAKLRGEPLGETVDLQTLSNLISALPDRERSAKRVGQLQLMIGQARQVSGK